MFPPKEPKNAPLPPVRGFFIFGPPMRFSAFSAHPLRPTSLVVAWARVLNRGHTVIHKQQWWASSLPPSRRFPPRGTEEAPCPRPGLLYCWNLAVGRVPRVRERALRQASRSLHSQQRLQTQSAGDNRGVFVLTSPP